MSNKVPQLIVLILLFVCYGFFLASKIDLTTADLGRHLKNGEVFINSLFKNSETVSRLLNSNFYSYTQPDYFFVNHHWGSGIFFFFIKKLLGFTGLSIFYLVVSLIVFFLFFKLSQKNSSFIISTLVALLLIPLIAERKEVRPEVFSYLFLALFFWILWHYQRALISGRYLIILPLLGIVWVNTHIYFIFGLFLIGVFFLERIFNPFLRDAKKIKNLILVFVFTAIAFLLSPFGLKGLFYPFNIFKEFGYRVVEMQPIWFLEKIGITNNPNLLLFEIVLFILVLSFILLFVLNRRQFSLSFFLLGTVFAIMALLALRNFTIFGLFALVVIPYNLKAIFQKIRLGFEAVEAIIVISFLIVIAFGFINNYQEIIYRSKGLGLSFDNSASADFFKKQNIHGPIFNNYDIGGYLIYYFFPKERVFVDGRPEAYSVSFFKEVYVPMQENNLIWQEQDKKYNFNAIFFSYRDYTPWGQKFLIDRIDDPIWTPVFADPYAIIFLKRNDLNKNIIEKYEIPREFFKITKLK